MSLYVGQHVRVVRNVGPFRVLDKLIGMTGHIERFVDPVGGGHDVMLRGCPFVFHRDELEPIVPPGLESIEGINALYEPEGVTA